MHSSVWVGSSWVAIATPAQKIGSRAAFAIIEPCHPMGL
jgi:hypothetical protein